MQYTRNLNLNKPEYDNIADINVLNENADILDEQIQGLKDGVVMSVNGITPTDNNVDIPNGEPVGFMSVCINGVVPAGWLPMLGGIYTRETYRDLFFDYAIKNNLVVSEQEWQTLYENQNGNVPYFSSGDGSTTFRVPSVRGWLKADVNAGQFVEAGLPNITGEMLGKVDGDCTGAFYKSDTRSRAFNGSDTNNRTGFDASRSNSIYGKSDTVQPFGLTTFYIIKAFGMVAKVGTTDIDRLVQAVERVERELENLRQQINN